MPSESQLHDQLFSLEHELGLITKATSAQEAQSLVAFFIDIVPRLFGAERCGIFYRDPNTEQMGSKYGTDLRAQSFEVSQESYAGRAAQTGASLLDNYVDPALPSQVIAHEITGFAVTNILCSPILSPANTRVSGVIQVMNKPADFSHHDIALLERVASHLAAALDSIWQQERIEALSEGVRQRICALQKRMETHGGLLTSDPIMHQVITRAEVVANTPASILLQGENGTGKELIARLIHKKHLTGRTPFVAVNCAAIPETLMESAFFGHERGAFTGAIKAHPGYFEEAASGILFLDEVGELPANMQAKLLRAIETREGRRLGGSETHVYNFRVVAATNRRLEEMIQAGTFRRDLYYRLFALSIDLPALRERPGDILPLAHHFLNDTAEKWNKPISGLTPAVQEAFEHYSWPGNIRQLRREVERLIALTPEGEMAELENCSPEVRVQTEPLVLADTSPDLTLKEHVRRLEQRIIERALKESNGNKERAAKSIGITRQALYYKLKGAMAKS